MSNNKLHGLAANGDYVGTCQACFGQYVVHTNGGLHIVLHGYKRPGYGSIHGECEGRNVEPFEVAKNLTENIRDNMVATVARLRVRAADLKAGNVKTLFVEVDDLSIPRKGWEQRATKWITIPVGWTNPDSHYDDFASRLRRAIFEIERDIENIDSEIVFFNKQLADWTYRPQALPNDGRKRIGVRAVDQAAVEAVHSSRHAARDIKEAHTRAVLDTLLACEALVARAKAKPYTVFDSKTREQVATPSTIWDKLEARLVKANAETNQVRRIELLAYTVGEWKDLANSYVDPIKVKLPRNKKVTK